jgi:hypothetical protein
MGRISSGSPARGLPAQRWRDPQTHGRCWEAAHATAIMHVQRSPSRDARGVAPALDRGRWRPSAHRHDSGMRTARQ